MENIGVNKLRYYRLDVMDTQMQHNAAYIIVLVIDFIIGILDEVVPNWQLLSQDQDRCISGLKLEFTMEVQNYRKTGSMG